MGIKNKGLEICSYNMHFMSVKEKKSFLFDPLYDYFSFFCFVFNIIVAFSFIFFVFLCIVKYIHVYIYIYILLVNKKLVYNREKTRFLSTNFHALHGTRQRTDIEQWQTVALTITQ